MAGAFSHTSVLLAETLRYLEPRSGGTYCDGTSGGAGHGMAILEASAPEGRLLALDRDPQAIAIIRERLAPYGSRASVVHAPFSELARVMAEEKIPGLDGLLLDLGVSSHQLDIPERGFSFLREGPLDMRMDGSSGESLAEYLDREDVDEVTRVLRDYGEERFAFKIAKAIKANLHELHTTTQLAALIESCIPMATRRNEKIHPATRSFQALRIAVNRELGELEDILAAFPDLLLPQGRFVVISFHSLEDRLVKHRFRELAWSSNLPADLAVKAGERVHPICRTLTTKPVLPSDEEIARNGRSRSAKLRACEKGADA